MNMPRLYWETLRHLRPVQIYGRAWSRAIRPQPNLCPAPPLRAHQGPWVTPARRRRSLTGSEEFCFLNEAHSLSHHGWDDPALSKLWRYNLHYFDDLNAEGAAWREPWHKALIARWIAENPPGAGSGWEPYPTSLRIVNWIKWALAGNAFGGEALHSLAIQTRWLVRRLEHHLLGNHLLANAKALVFAGSFFSGREAEGWRQLGFRLLEREVDEQILADGGHFELSTMYHALALEDMLDLVNVMRSSGATVPPAWGAKIAAMRGWLACMCHPDGEIAFFNDAAIGIAPSPKALERYARRLGFPSREAVRNGCTWLRDSGYIRLQDSRAVALIDVARVGPDHLPGHAHADTLSFELSVRGQRVIVNSGTSLYGSGLERQRQRGTAAHNTVVIDGQDSSEVWSGFRVARRARPHGLSVTQAVGGPVVACGHDGYARLPGRPYHHRTWIFAEDGLTVRDAVRGSHAMAEALFHFHPDHTAILSEDGRSGRLISASTEVLRWRLACGEARLQPSSWHSEFGLSQPSQCLAVRLSEGESAIEFQWSAA